MTTRFFGLTQTRALHQHAGNDLKAVRNLVLHFLQQDCFLANEIVFKPSRGSLVGHIGNRHQQPDVILVSVINRSSVDDRFRACRCGL